MEWFSGVFRDLFRGFPKLSAKDSPRKLYFLVLIVYTLFFAPIVLNSGLYIDDKVLLTSITTEVEFYKNSLLEVSFDSFLDFFRSGRFYGLYALHYVIFYFCHEVLNYHVAKAIFNLIAVLSFAWFVKLFTKNNYNYWAFIFLAPTVFLVSIHDPLATQGLSTQISLIFIALTCSFYTLFNQTRKKIYFVFSCILFFWSFFYYEIGLCIVPIMVILATKFRLQSNDQNYKTPNKIGLKPYLLSCVRVCLKELRFHFLILFVWIGCCVAIRKSSAQFYDGIEFGFSFKDFLLTWIVEAVRSLPLSFSNYKLYLGSLDFSDFLLAGILSLLCYIIFLKFLPKINFANCNRELVLIGLSLVLVPSLIVSLSSKYQNWALSFNSAFVQIFLQYFGVTLLIMAFVAHSLKNSETYNSKSRHKFLIQFLAILLALIIGVTSVLNKNISIKKNAFESYNNYEILVRAINGGLMNDMPKSKPQYFDLIDSVETRFPKYFKFLLTSSQKNIGENIGENVDKDKARYFFNPQYENKSKLFSFVKLYFASNFFAYHGATSPIIISFYDREGIDFLRQEFELKNSYYLEDGETDFDVLNENFNPKNLSGFVLFSRLDKIVYKCQDESFSKKCGLALTLFSPKIFIDKRYLFKLDSVVQDLNFKFGENVFKNYSIEKLRKDLAQSKDGILLALEPKAYRLFKN